MRISKCADDLYKCNWSHVGHMHRRLEKFKDCKSKGLSEINLELGARVETKIKSLLK